MKRFVISFPLLISALLSGCGSGYTEYVADSSGRLHPVTHYRDVWEHIFEEKIAAEIRGDPPPAHCKTWKEYWQKEYVVLANQGEQSGSKSWGPKHIAQARALRIKYGLDPY